MNLLNKYGIGIIAFLICSIAYFMYAESNSKGFVNQEQGDAGIIEGIKKLFSDKADKYMPPEDYVAFCEKPGNSLHVSKSIDNFEYTTFCKPIDYLVLKDLKSLTGISEKIVNSKKQEFGNMEYFSLKINLKDGSEDLLKYDLHSEQEYYQRLEYFSFHMQKDLKLVFNTDTVDCLLFHYERTFNLAPHATFIIGFPKPENTRVDNLKLIIDDKLFNNGKVILGFNAAEINEFPKLKLN